MKTKRYVYVPTKFSGNELKEKLAEHFDDTVYSYIMEWFKKNPKKTCCHIPQLKIKVRKYGYSYTLENA